jgi:hypothetical protein
MRSHYSTYIKPPLNPSKRGKNRSERRKRNQTVDETTMEKRGIQLTYPRVTRKGSSKTTVKHWPVFTRPKLTSTKQIRHPAGTVDVTAIICWNVLQRRHLRGLNWPPQW